MRKFFMGFIKLLPFLIIGICVICLWQSGIEPNVESVLSYMPKNLTLAALTVLAMYAVKSLSVIFPMLILQVAAGLIFPLWQALAINIIGTGITYTIPYFIGKFSGADALDNIIKKHPKAKSIIEMQRGNAWFPSFFLRAVSCLPADIVSMCLGCTEVPYLSYVIASVAGTLPGLIPATVAGTSIMNPKSAVFIISVIVTAASSVVSVLIYAIMKRKSRRSI